MSSKSRAVLLAEYLVYVANSVGQPITNLKLQKLMYYAQAWYLAGLNKPVSEPLFNDPIEAWVLGPAVRSVYKHFKHSGNSPIEMSFDENQFESITNEEIEILDEIYMKYGKFTASQLVQITHSEKPWQDARLGLDLTTHSEKEIPLESIKDFYKKLLNH